ncbi:ATP-dependent DNA helicase RecG [Calycomorphotria hydatis]|nr:ATP-dependent DNA helicase RecG [Calycomorphotria hydatis]
MPDDPLNMPAQYLKGAGARRVGALSRLGLETVRDVLFNLPRDVLDLSNVVSAGELRGDAMQTVRGVVVDRDARAISRGRTMTSILLDSDGEYVRGTWFNQPWMLKKFDMQQQVLFSGKPKKREGRWEFSHPRVQWLDDELDGEDVSNEEIRGMILPRYPLTEGLTMEALRFISRGAVEDYASLVTDPLPAPLQREWKMPSLTDAVRQLHCPESVDLFNAAKQRLLFDDLFEFQLALALRRRDWAVNQRAYKIETSPKVDSRIRRLFPFDFTEGQNKAVREIAIDLATPRAMHRLLQADVGAGKTVVALYAMLTTIAAGYQTVLMAPTEVLANQHWRTVTKALSHSRVKQRLLTGSLTAAERKKVHAEIQAGEVDLLVGTQAVIQDAVSFAKLGLAVIDEQHKFGVAQRARFGLQEESEENAIAPHLLVMTATPIPRSLCLTQFGDLDVTRITELPPGRQRVVTSRVDGTLGRERAWEFIREQLEAGRQAYVVCPRIERNAEDDGSAVAGSVEAVYDRLIQGELRKWAARDEVRALHGRLSSDEKESIMQSFRAGDVRVLISTTVIEVGVDVPNATMMVVFQANQFGLSQLHQLRGRIGRGRFQGYCFLLTENETDDAAKRLAVMEQTSDGFKIAEADFEIRGPGDVLGTRQSGGLPLKRAHPQRDFELLLTARERAFEIVRNGDIDRDLFEPLRQEVINRFGEKLELPRGG